MESLEQVERYFLRHTVDAVLWKADRLLGGVDNPFERNLNFEAIARMIAQIPGASTREDYTLEIGRRYHLKPDILKKMIAGAIQTRQLKKIVRKNEVIKLDGRPETFPFFEETFDKSGSFKSIRINRKKFFELLASFGFCRYSVEKDNYTFVRLDTNIIYTVTEDDIIDHLEDFILERYDFNVDNRFEHVTAEKLLNKFYDNLYSYFNKKMFARVKLSQPVIINRDTVDTTFLYYDNGFVRINRDGYEFLPYDNMDGSVWDHQVKRRDFIPMNNIADHQVAELGNFADFCWRLSGENQDRFKSLCSIIGYCCHDFYDYKLKAVLLTDSTVSDVPMGRTGKSLVFEMLAHVRSVAFIDGKEYNPSDKHKFEDVQLGTQIVCFDDIKHKGRNAFDFEDFFNLLFKGIKVNAKYMTPFQQLSKISITTNKSLNIVGDSQADRIIEFEVAPFFSKEYSPADHYKQWFGRDWDAGEWQKFDNFICWCCQVFHRLGLVDPPIVNLNERKLRDHTRPEFLDFITERIEARLQQKMELVFDKKELYEDFRKEFVDFQKLSQHAFTKWLKMLGMLRYANRYKEWRSNGKYWIEFKHPKE